MDILHPAGCGGHALQLPRPVAWLGREAGQHEGARLKSVLTLRLSLDVFQGREDSSMSVLSSGPALRRTEKMLQLCRFSCGHPCTQVVGGGAVCLGELTAPALSASSPGARPRVQLGTGCS